MEWSREMIRKTKGFFCEHYGVGLSTEDAIETLDNLTSYVRILVEIYEREKAEGRDILNTHE